MLAYLERVVPQELDSILMMMPDQNLGLVATLLGGTNHRRERLYSLCVSEFAGVHISLIGGPYVSIEK